MARLLLDYFLKFSGPEYVRWAVLRSRLFLLESKQAKMAKEALIFILKKKFFFLLFPTQIALHEIILMHHLILKILAHLTSQAYSIDPLIKIP